MSRRTLLLSLMLLVVVMTGAFARRTHLQRGGVPRLSAASVSDRRVEARPLSEFASLLPPGALLTIESPDFAQVLHTWTQSPEAAAWMASASYSVFSNSRLFGRLSEAQDEFASTARLRSAGTSLLKEVAGRESIFAWYDVGQLQFLYITRMPRGTAEASALFSQRVSFHRRQVGNAVFYVRSESAPGSTRTVAFGAVGDLLLLSTREDLLAGALERLTAPAPHSPTGSLAAEPWYTEASAAQPGEPAAPALHMVLDLARISKMPYFRSYWIQGNVSEIASYRSAVADLYREQVSGGPRFREERILLPAEATAIPGSEATPSAADDPDLGSLAALVPPGTAVYRAERVSDAASAVRLLDEKLLSHRTDLATPGKSAPDPSLSPDRAGDPADLETRIDTPAPVSASASASALQNLLRAADLQASLSLETTFTPDSGIWLPLHAAVVLRTRTPLPPTALQAALADLLRGELTASDLGIEFQPLPNNPAIVRLSGPRPLFVAQSTIGVGALTLVSDDLAVLRALLTRVSSSASAVQPATLLAGFDHTATRASLVRLTSLIDHAGAADQPAVSVAQSGETAIPPFSPATDSSEDTADPSTAPPFFSGNLASLSATFARLRSMEVTVRHLGPNVHQTVLYQWQP